MADETLPDIYQALHDLKVAQQDLLVVEKLNRSPGTTTPADARRKVIAQWGNLVDGLLLQLLAHAGSGVRSVLAHGAVADGVTSNTTAIQAAIDAADAAGGGIVVVPLGCAQYSSLTLRAGVRLVWIADADPNSALDGADGDLVVRLDGSTTLYVKTGGTSNTGWMDAFAIPHGDEHAAGGDDPLQVSAANRILGRVTSGAGDVEELTAEQVGALVATTIDHGATTGKGDDDHPQYLLAAGGRDYTGATLAFTHEAAAITLGSATTAGNAQVRFNKGDVNNQSTLRWDMGGVSQWLVQHDTSENWNLLDSANALVLRARRADSNLESRGIRPIADSAHDLGTSTVRWAVVYADTVDVGDGSGSPRFYLNKTATGDAYVTFRQTQGSDTDGDVRIGMNASEQFVVERRASGSYATRAYLSSTLGWVFRNQVHVGASGSEKPGATLADDLMIGDQNTSEGSGITIWTGGERGRIAYSLDGSLDAWIDFDAQNVVWQFGVSPGVRWNLDASALYPESNKGGTLGTSIARAQYAFLGTPSYDVQTGVDNTTINLGDVGYVQISAATGAVTLNLPASTAANEGKTYYIDVINASNSIFLDPPGTDTINGHSAGAPGNIGTHGTGLYILTILGDGTSRVFGPIARPSFT